MGAADRIDAIGDLLESFIITPAPIFVFSDLDDSLFQTRRKCPLQADLFEAALDRQGEPLPDFTGQQKALMTLLQQGTLIPVTGRNTAALERVKLDFRSYRITSHGALILDEDGQPDQQWLNLIGEQHRQWQHHMQAALAWIERSSAGLAVRHRIIEDQGLPVYVSIKGDETALADLEQRVHETWGKNGSQVHRNGQNMALLPPFARKERAVEFVMRRLQLNGVDPLFIGLGDSLTDAPFMQLCHYALIPRQSQIRDLSWG